MTDREPLVVSGVVLGLVVATLVPFALAAGGVDGPWSASPPPTVGGKSDPAMASPGPTPGTPRDVDGRASLGSGTPAGAADAAWMAQPSLAPPAVSCDVAAGGADPSLPLAVDGRAVTGAGVDVAVVDPSGFDVDDPRFGDQVVATRSFSSRGPLAIDNDGADRHGTESAATVARLAPDAALHLANVRTARDFVRAVDWAVEREVDVIVAPVSFYAKPNDGSAPVSAAVTRALEAGIPVVVPAGNVARRHWEGRYEGGPWLAFEGDDTRLYLEGDDDPVQLWLWWNRSDDEERHDFEVVLYRDRGRTVERVAASSEYPVGPVGTNQVLYERIRTNDLLSSSLGDGTYFVRVRGPANATHRVELVATAHPLASPVPHGSLAAPATARGPVVAVGAADPSTGEPLATSSWGPTNDGRPGVDLLAPGRVVGPDGTTFTGTSAAAAYAGGVVALLTAVRPSLAPADVEAVLQASARPTEGPGGDLQTGHGRLDPRAALACAAEVELPTDASS